jgi:hypothetical protein
MLESMVCLGVVVVVVIEENRPKIHTFEKYIKLARPHPIAPRLRILDPTLVI